MKLDADATRFFHALFERIASDIGYDNLVGLTDYRGGEWVGTLARALPDDPGYILDLGCANGYTGRILRAHGFRGVLTGVDFSERMLEQCRVTKAYDRCVQHDLNQPWPAELHDQKYDLVTAFGFIEYVPDQRSLLARIREALAPDGVLWITFESNTGRRDPEPLKILHSERTASELLEHTGFRVDMLEERSAHRHVRELTDTTVTTSETYVPYVLAVARR